MILHRQMKLEQTILHLELQSQYPIHHMLATIPLSETEMNVTQLTPI